MNFVFPDLVNNGKLVAAVAALVDAIFGVLVAMGAIQAKPDSGLILAVVTIAFNALAAVLAYIQHTQAVVKASFAHEKGTLKL